MVSKNQVKNKKESSVEQECLRVRREMKSPNHHLRIDLAELKSQMVKKLGQEVAKQYFYYLSRFMNLKTTKTEFDKICFRVLGRDNIPLHNHLIRSVLKNASTAKSPPPPKKDVPKHATQVSVKEIRKDAYLSNGSHTGVTQASCPGSPRRCLGNRSVARLNGKTSISSNLSNATQLRDFDVLENGDINHHQELADPFKPSVIKRMLDGSARIPLEAPLGVPFIPTSFGGVRGAHPIETNSRCVGACSTGYLSDTHALRERMEQIATVHNLEGLSVECANTLYHGLDSYLKGLIMSCVELVGVRSGQELVKSNMKLVNGMRPGYLDQIQNNGKKYPISLQDFRVAMEMNPRQLREDWPLLLEKICTESSEE